MLNCLVPCPDCKKPEKEHLVACTVTRELLDELGVDSAEDIDHAELHYRAELGDGATIDGVCSECGSPYVRDSEGNIISD